jgi:hypothetical protein
VGRVLLVLIDAHAYWVSNRMLQLMAPLPDDSDGGRIIRDEHRKFIDVFLFFGSSILEIEPLGLNFFYGITGVYVANAMDLVSSQPFSEARTMEYSTRAASDALAVSLTSTHNAFSVLEEIQFYSFWRINERHVIK